MEVGAWDVQGLPPLAQSAPRQSYAPKAGKPALLGSNTVVRPQVAQAQCERLIMACDHALSLCLYNLFSKKQRAEKKITPDLRLG